MAGYTYPPPPTQTDIGVLDKAIILVNLPSDPVSYLTVKHTLCQCMTVHDIQCNTMRRKTSLTKISS